MSSQPLTFDAAQLLHLVGPALYADALAFLDELLRNSYNADAETVRLSCLVPSPRAPIDRLDVLDDGHGMSPGEVCRYFTTVGTDSARSQPYSPRGRRKMGGHGIGRFSAFGVCDRMEVYTRRRGQPVCLVHLERATLFADPPMSQIAVLPAPPPDVPLGEAGTLIRLTRFTRPLRRDQLVRRVLTRFTRDFFARLRVEVDGRRLVKHWPQPHRRYRLPDDFPPAVVEGLPPSVIGELVYVDNPQQLLPDEVGLALTVGGTIIRVERFGEMVAPSQALHLTGWVAADHLRHLQDASRTGFQVHAPEYQLLTRALHRAAALVYEREERRARRLADTAEARALQVVLARIMAPLRQALHGRVELAAEALPDVSWDIDAPPAACVSGRSAPSAPLLASSPAPDGRRSCRRRRRLPILVSGACLGTEVTAPEAIMESEQRLLLNIEHPLFRRARADASALEYHCARLITQHLAERLAPPLSSPAEVFGLQGELLRAVLVGRTRRRHRVA